MERYLWIEFLWFIVVNHIGLAASKLLYPSATHETAWLIVLHDQGRPAITYADALMCDTGMTVNEM